MRENIWRETPSFIAWFLISSYKNVRFKHKFAQFWPFFQPSILVLRQFACLQIHFKKPSFPFDFGLTVSFTGEITYECRPRVICLHWSSVFPWFPNMTWHLYFESPWHLYLEFVWPKRPNLFWRVGFPVVSSPYMTVALSNCELRVFGSFQGEFTSKSLVFHLDFGLVVSFTREIYLLCKA